MRQFRLTVPLVVRAPPRSCSSPGVGSGSPAGKPPRPTGTVRRLGTSDRLVAAGPGGRRRPALPGPPGDRQDDGRRHRPGGRAVPGHPLPDLPGRQGGGAGRGGRHRGGPALLGPGGGAWARPGTSRRCWWPAWCRRRPAVGRPPGAGLPARPRARGRPAPPGLRPHGPGARWRRAPSPPPSSGAGWSPSRRPGPPSGPAASCSPTSSTPRRGTDLTVAGRRPAPGAPVRAARDRGPPARPDRAGPPEPTADADRPVNHHPTRSHPDDHP